MIVVFKIQFAINFFMADIIFNMTGIIQFIRDSPVYVIIIHFLNFDILIHGGAHAFSMGTSGIIHFIRDSPVFVIIIHFPNVILIHGGAQAFSMGTSGIIHFIRTHQFLSSSFIFLSLSY